MSGTNTLKKTKLFATKNELSVTGIAGSGTLNYIAKFTPNGDEIGNSQIFDNSIFVGINQAVAIAGSNARFIVKTLTNKDGWLHTDGTIKLVSQVGWGDTGWVGTVSLHNLGFFAGNGYAAAGVKYDATRANSGIFFISDKITGDKILFDNANLSAERTVTFPNADINFATAATGTFTSVTVVDGVVVSGT